MLYIYALVFVLLVILEYVYFGIAKKFNIVDKPNARSSHSKVVILGGGIIFAIAPIIWTIWMLLADKEGVLSNGYLAFIAGMVMVAAISFIDDIKSLPQSARLVVQLTATALLLYGAGFWQSHPWWMMLAFVALIIVFAGATNIFNFMDGLNGMMVGYSLAVMIPMRILNGDSSYFICPELEANGFIDSSFLIVTIIALVIFMFFNYRPKNKALCFAGDVGSISVAFVLLFALGRLIKQTDDITWLCLFAVYGVDGCLTIIHRLMLHEHIGQAHRKHCYQIMANELKLGHLTVSTTYTCIQLVISLMMIYLIPDNQTSHWIYFISVLLVLSTAYILFMKKYYHLHEEYLESVKKG